MSRRDKITDCVPNKDPVARPDYTEAQVQALRALYRGEADARQQRMALDWIMTISGKDDMPYRPGDPHGTAFAAGKMWVGQTVVWGLFHAETTTNPDKIATRKVGDDPNDRSDNR